MTTAPASWAALACAASWPPSTAPMMTTLAPLVIIDWICDCWSATAPEAPAYCTSPLKPASFRPLVKRSPARTQFSDVLVGRATPMVAPLSKPEAVESPPEPPRPPPEQPVRASAAAAATATVASAILRIAIYFLCLFGMVQVGGEERGGSGCQRARRVLGRLTGRDDGGLLLASDVGATALVAVEHPAD